MSRPKTIVMFLAAVLLASTVALAQDSSKGGIKGKVRVAERKAAAAGVTVTVKQDEREVAHVVTDHKGEFSLTGLQPGTYGLTFQKPGLSVGTLGNVEVKAGKMKSLPDRLILTSSESTIARLAGSVFNEAGRSMPNVRIELARVAGDGSKGKRIDDRLTSESGQFVFRVSPDRATYRITVKADGMEDQTKDVEVDGAMVYRVAFTLQRPPS
jgi:carboxypeptidase family protein